MGKTCYTIQSSFNVTLKIHTHGGKVYKKDGIAHLLAFINEWSLSFCLNEHQITAEIPRYEEPSRGG